MDSGFNARIKSIDSWTEDEIDKEGQALVEYMSIKENMWIKGFCHSRGYPSHVFKNWLEYKRGNFEHYYTLAMEMQERKLVEMPFFRKADGQHARFILSCFHSDWIPQQKVQMAQDIRFEGVSYGQKDFQSFDVNTLKSESSYKTLDDKEDTTTT